MLLDMEIKYQSDPMKSRENIATCFFPFFLRPHSIEMLDGASNCPMLGSSNAL